MPGARLAKAGGLGLFFGGRADDEVGGDETAAVVLLSGGVKGRDSID